MVRMMSPGLFRYVAGRLLRALLTVVGLVTIVFLLVRLIPGDPVEAILGDQAGPEEKAELRRTLEHEPGSMHRRGSLLREVVAKVVAILMGAEADALYGASA